MSFYRWLFLTLLSLICWTQCSTFPVDENNPVSLLKEAEEEIENHHYLMALEKLRVIKNKFPYSPYSIDAQLRIADVYFLQESYTEAAIAYTSFRDLHPNHPKVSYALIKTAQSYAADAPSQIERDLSSAQKALQTYRDFLRDFPQSTETQQALQAIQALEELLAKKELRIALFYLKRDFPLAAKPRYQKIITTYPNTQAAKEALTQLEKIQSLTTSEQ